MNPNSTGYGNSEAPWLTAEPPSDPIADYCTGPGHLYAPRADGTYDRTPGDLLELVEPCPTCHGKAVRNHQTSRRATALPAAVAS